MTKIRIGQCWMARFSKREIAVRLDEERPDGGWFARVLSHGRKVVVKDERQLLFRCDENGIRAVADETIPNRRSNVAPPEESPAIGEVSKPSPPVFTHSPMSLLDAAAVVLRMSRRPLSTREIIALIFERNLWKSTGATPWQTLNAALGRDLAAKGENSRFIKIARSKFTVR